MTDTETLLSDDKALARTLREKVGISGSYAHELAHGVRVPSLHLAVRIEAALGIAPRTWVERFNEGFR